MHNICYFGSSCFQTFIFCLIKIKNINPLIRLFLLLLISSLPVLGGNHGDFNITNYNIGSGLSTSKIHDSAQDTLGRVWFATALGASVYDGYKWTNYDLLDETNKSGFKNIRIDQKGVVWLSPMVAPWNILFFKGNKWEVFSKAPELSNKLPYTTGFDVIYIDDKPVVVIAASNELFICYDGKWQKFDKSNSPITSEIRGLTAFETMFYIATGSGLFSLEFDRNIKAKISGGLFDIKDPLSAVTVHRHPGSSPHFYILSTNWLGIIEKDKLTKVALPSKIDVMKQFPYHFIVSDKDEKIYYGNKVSKYLYDPNGNSFYALDKNSELTSDGATSTLVDAENNVWFTDFRGVDKITFHPFTNYTKKSGLLEDEVTAVLEYQPGNFIFGHNSGFTIYKDGIFTPVYFTGAQGTKTIVSRLLDLTIDDKGKIWGAAGYYGLVSINPDGSHIREITTLSSVTSVIFDKKSGLIVATDSGLFKVENSKLVKIETGFKDFNFRKFFRFGEEIFIVGTNGIYKLENGKTVNLISEEPVFSANVFSFFKDDDGSFFAGTESGLYSVENKRLKKFKKNGFSISKSVYFIVKSNDGNYWFGTIDGLMRWDGKNNVFEYSTADGLAGYEMNRSAAVIDSKNVFWIGTNTGLSTYRIGSKTNKVAPPNVFFLNFETSSGEQFSLYKDAVVPHTDNSLIFSFRGISYISESSIEYKIKLEGFDKDFYTINQSQLFNIRYSNLPSGSYRLIVMAKNRFSEWSEPVYSATIVVERPLYFKLWFILLTLFVITGSAVLIYKYFIVSREQALLEAMVSERTKALQESEEKLKVLLENLEVEVQARTKELEKLNRTKDRIFSIISHDLRSPFMSILGFSEILDEEVDEMDKAVIKSYTEKILAASRNTVSLVDGLLEWSRLQIGGVVPAHEDVDLNAIIEEVHHLFNPQLSKKGLVLNVVFEEVVHLTTDANIIRSILRNLVSNAIKFTRKGGKITVSLVKNSDSISLSVEDTGIGIPKDMLPGLFSPENIQSRKGTSNERGTGLGLNITHDFVLKLGGEITVESQELKGSKFTVTLPLEIP